MLIREQTRSAKTITIEVASLKANFWRTGKEKYEMIIIISPSKDISVSVLFNIWRM